MATDSKNGTSPEEQAAVRKHFNRIGLWQLANSIRQNLGVSRAAVESQYANTVKDFSFLEELPLGSTTNVTINEPRQEKKNPLKTAALAALLAAASGGAGYLAHDYFAKPSEPVPIDINAEWEVPIVGGQSSEDSGSRAEDAGEEPS